MNTQEMQTEPSVLVAPYPSGAVLFQGGLHTQALVLTRSEIDRFLIAPAMAEPLVIPSFASAGLACFTATGTVDYISLHRQPELPEEFSLSVKLRHGDHIVYYSHAGHVDELADLGKRGVTVVITPRSISTIHGGDRPSLSVVANLPHMQQPNLAGIYAVEPELLRSALEEALTKINNTKHHDSQ